MIMRKDDFLEYLEEGRFNLIEKFEALVQYEEDAAYIVYLELLKDNINEIISESIDICIFSAFEKLSNQSIASDILEFLLSKNILLSTSKTSIRYYYADCQLKDEEGCFKEGFKDEWIKQIALAFEDDRNTKHLLEIGILLFNKDLQEKSQLDEAFKYFEKAANFKCIESMEFLSKYYREGLGSIEIDINKAAEWNVQKGVKSNHYAGCYFDILKPKTYDQFGYCSLDDFANYLSHLTQEQRINLIKKLNAVEQYNKE
jgi:TPR repeat protein